MKNKLGVIVIGQSPRPDCVELFGKCLFDGDEVIVKGALDRNLEPITVPEVSMWASFP